MPRGRPINPNSQRQIDIAKRAANAAAGIKLKRGPAPKPDGVRGRQRLIKQLGEEIYKRAFEIDKTGILTKAGLKYLVKYKGGHYTLEKLQKVLKVMSELDYNKKYNRKILHELVNKPDPVLPVMLRIELYQVHTQNEKDDYDAEYNQRITRGGRGNKRKINFIKHGDYWLSHFTACNGIYQSNEVEKLPPPDTFICIDRKYEEYDEEAAKILRSDDEVQEVLDYLESAGLAFAKYTITQRPQGGHEFGANTNLRDMTVLNIANKYVRNKINSDADTFGEYITPKCDSGYMINSCLFTAIIIIYWAAIEKTERGKKWKKTHSVSYDGLIPGMNGGPCSIAMMIEAFFKPLRLGLRVIDAGNNIKEDCCYHPDMNGETLEKNINPQIMTILIHDEHAFICDAADEIKELFPYDYEKKMFIARHKREPKINIVGNYPQPYERNTDVKYLESIDDIALDKNQNNFIYDGDIRKLALELKMIGCTVQCGLVGATINKITLTLGDRVINIRNHVEGNEKRTCNLELMNIENKLDTYYLDEKYKSYYEEDTKRVFTENMCPAIVEDCIEGLNDAIGVDFKKFYTSCFLDIDYFPTISSFDRWVKYDGEPIEDYNFYMVMRCGEKDRRDLWTYRENCIIIGSILKTKIEVFEIIMYLRPSGLHKHDKKLINDIINSAEDESNAKHGINRFIGRLNKSKTESSTGMFFLHENEAAYFAENMGYTKGTYQHFDIKCGDHKKRLWLVKTQQRTVSFSSGFIPIYHVLRNIAMQKLQHIYDLMLSERVSVYGFKTDCIFVRPNKALKEFRKAHPELFNYSTFAESIGKLDFEDCALRNFSIKPESEFTPFIPEDAEPSEQITLSNEFMVDSEPTDEMVEIFDNHNDILMTSELPGSGKSHITMAYIKTSGLKTLVVSYDKAPSRRIKKSGHQFSTLHNFFGMDIKEKVRDGVAYKNKLDQDGIQCIIFEEIAKSSLRFLQRIKEFVVANRHKYRIFANGDDFQLLCEYTDKHAFNNIGNFADYKFKCIKSIFKSNLHLLECKRFKDESDVNKIKKIKKMLFVDKVPVRVVAEKFFNPLTDDVRDDDVFITYSNIAAFNIRNKRSDTMEVGDIVRCREHTGKKNIYVNDIFEIIGVGNKKYILQNTEDGEEVSVSEFAMFKFFEPSGAITCHSSQGETITSRIVICEYDNEFANDPRWLYTGITRAEHLSNVVLMSGVDAINRRQMFNTIKQKIEAYKEQDMKRFGEIDEEKYITSNSTWKLLKDYKLRCCRCHCGVSHTWTLNRLDNSLGHIVGNVEVMCLHCNKTLH